MNDKTAKTTKIDAQTEASAAAAPIVNTFAPVAQVLETLKTAQEKIQVPPAAREFVVRNAEAAKGRVADAEQSAHKVANSVEQALVAMVGAGARITRRIIEANVANANLVIGGVQSVAQATSAQDAAKRYVDFVRTYGQANLLRAQTDYASARQAVAEGAKALEAEFGKLNLGKLNLFGAKKAA